MTRVIQLVPKVNQTKKTSISDYETQTSFEYLKNNTKEFFENYPDVFDLNLKRYFNYIVSQEEKHVDYNLLSGEILLPSGDVLNFFNKHGDLCDFWTNVLLMYSNNDIVLQEVNFLKDLLNGFGVYKNILKPKNEPDYEAEDLYLKLLGNLNKTVGDILFLKTSTDEYRDFTYRQKHCLM